MLTLLVEFADEASVFNVFRYITFRTGGALITSALLVFLFGPTDHQFAAGAAGQGPADPRRRTADAFQEGRHADDGRADDPVGHRRLVAAVGQSQQRLCLGGAAGDAGLRRDRLLRRLSQGDQAVASRLFGQGAAGDRIRHRRHRRLDDHARRPGAVLVVADLPLHQGLHRSISAGSSSRSPASSSSAPAMRST